MVFIRSSAYVRILLNNHKESVSSRIANRSHNYMRLCCSSKEVTDINSGVSYSKKTHSSPSCFFFRNLGSVCLTDCRELAVGSFVVSRLPWLIFLKHHGSESRPFCGVNMVVAAGRKGHPFILSSANVIHMQAESSVSYALTVCVWHTPV